MTEQHLPHVISFYAGSQYYYDAAESLKADCLRLGIPHNIVELQVPEGFDWGSICRRKIEFYREQLRELKGPVMWVDVDSSILRPPSVLAACRFDIAGYARHHRYIRDYDKYFSSRFWMPQVLFFNDTPRAHRFLDHLAEIERTSTACGSDDYFMQEAWASFTEMMSVGLLPPQTLAMKADEINDETIVCFRASGNVSSFVKTMEQHVPPYKTPYFRKKVFEASAAEARLAGDKAEATLMLRRAFMLDKADATCALKLAEVLRLQGEADESMEVLRLHQHEAPDDQTATKRIVNSLIAHERFEEARNQLDLLLQSPVAGSKEFAESRLFRVELEERAEKMGLQRAQRPALWWMESPYPGNFGDVLNPYIVEKVSGIPPRFSPRGRGMLAIGSVIKFARSGTEVWGTGTPRMTDTLSTNAVYSAVRGPLTRKLVIASGGRAPDVLGDPALLLPLYYTPPAGKRFKLGLIPHVCHLAEDFSTSDVLVISPSLVGYGAIEAFIDAIACCEHILTTSLHGLIVANAFGVPARWCHFGGDAPSLAGDGTKFHDYFMSVGLPIQESLDLARFDSIDPTLARFVDQTVELRFDAKALLDAYPGQRLPWSQVPPGQLPCAAELADLPWRQLLLWDRAMEDESVRRLLGLSLFERVLQNPSSMRVYLREMAREGQLDLVREFSIAAAGLKRAALIREAGVLSQAGCNDAADAVLEAIDGMSQQYPGSGLRNTAG